MDPAAPSFAGSIPEMYQRYVVPLMFEHYASDLAGRVVHRARGPVLEVAAGTGVVTRKLASALPADIDLTVTDLSSAMLAFARSLGRLFGAHSTRVLRRRAHQSATGHCWLRAPQNETIAARSRGESAAFVATALCQSTPLRDEIEAGAPGRLQEITELAAAAVERQFGSGVIEAKMQARVIVVSR